MYCEKRGSFKLHFKDVHFIFKKFQRYSIFVGLLVYRAFLRDSDTFCSHCDVSILQQVFDLLSGAAIHLRREGPASSTRLHILSCTTRGLCVSAPMRAVPERWSVNVIFRLEQSIGSQMQLKLV